MAPILRLRRLHQQEFPDKKDLVKVIHEKRMPRLSDILLTRSLEHCLHSSNVILSPLRDLLLVLSSVFPTAIVKLFSTRRNPDAAQKQQILESASTVANVLLKHLEPMESGE